MPVTRQHSVCFLVIHPALRNASSDNIEMKDVEEEDEELDSDEETRICAKFMTSGTGLRRYIVQESEDHGMDIF